MTECQDHKPLHARKEKLDRVGRTDLALVLFQDITQIPEKSARSKTMAGPSLRAKSQSDLHETKENTEDPNPRIETTTRVTQVAIILSKIFDFPHRTRPPRAR